MATIVPNTSLQSLNEALYRLSLLNEEKKKGNLNRLNI